MITLGMIPDIDPEKVTVSGNSAGAGAIMVLCDENALLRSIELAEKITTVDLACDPQFQEVFVQKLGFPILKN